MPDIYEPQRCGMKNQCREIAQERDKLRAEIDEESQLRENLADILKRTAIGLRGPEPDGTMYSWHDLPERAINLRAHVEALKFLLRWWMDERAKGNPFSATLLAETADALREDK